MAWSIKENHMSHKTWGGRFKKPIHPKVAEFNASLHFDHVLYEYDIRGSQVHAQMLARQGLISTDEANSICQALTEIKGEITEGLHPLDIQAEDIHMFIEGILIAKIGDVGKKLHTGRSRNDQVALDLRLYAKDVYQLINKQLQTLITVLNDLSKEHHQHSMPGYTHLQQAQPISLGHYFAAYENMLQRDLARLNDWQQRMNYSPLGAGALAGSALPLDRLWVAQELGFSGVINNTLDAVSDRDFVIEFCGLASIIMMHLSRLAEDLILWATQEFNFLTLDDAFATGSSLMPNKKNPDVLELIRGKSGRVFGHLVGILTVMKGQALAYNKDMQEDKECFFDTVNTLSACLEIISPFLQSLQFNTGHMQQQTNQGHLHATAILESLVLKGVPFRDAHHQVGEMILESIEHNRPLLKPVPHLITGLELTSNSLAQLLHLSTQVKQYPEQYQQSLVNKNLSLIFEKPSYRTRLSFTRAMQSLGGTVIESISNTRKTEEPKDLMRVLNGYTNAVMIRTHDDGILQEMIEHATIPVINGLSALHHPCQALADLLTLKEHFENLEGITLAYIGDGNNVLNSLLLLAPQLGVNIHYCCPKGKGPNPDILKQSELLAVGVIKGHATPEQAVCHADAVYTDVWTSMGFENDQQEQCFANFQINEELMAQAKPNAIFMHCMPMERGKEVSDTLPDCKNSVIFKQSENRMHVQKALLLVLLGKSDKNHCT